MSDYCAIVKASLEDPVIQRKLNKRDPHAVSKIKAIASPRPDLDRSIISFGNLRRRCPLDQTSTSTISSTPHWKDTVLGRPLGDLGELDWLPLEILHTLFGFLDLQTLTDIRAVSRRAMLVVDSLPSYKDVYTHAPDVLRAMLSLQLARHFFPHDISSQLRCGECYLCGDFGALLFLPNCRRCCWHCLNLHEDTLPITQNHAKESFRLTKDALQQLPSMLSLPGSYGNTYLIGRRVRLGGRNYRHRERLVSLDTARMIVVRLHGREMVSSCFMDSPRQRWVRAYEEWLSSLPPTSVLTQPVAKPPYPPYTRGSRCQGYEPRRYMAAIHIPFLDVANGMTEWGLCCLGCSETFIQDAHLLDESRRKYLRRMYTKIGLIQHAQECKAAQKLWEEEKNAIHVALKDIDIRILDERQISWRLTRVRHYCSLGLINATSQLNTLLVFARSNPRLERLVTRRG